MAVNMLVSFAFFGGVDLNLYRAKMPCGRLMLDSGAFTAYSTGKPIELAAYAEYLETYASAIDHAITLDEIGDPVGTRRNTRKLHQLGHAVMPVFTRGDRMADFDAMVKDARYVCIGGGVGMPYSVLIPRLAGLQRRAEELGGGIHALGIGTMDGLRRIRPYSADSSTISSAFLYGNLVCYDGRHVRTIHHTQRKRLALHLDAYKNQGMVADVAAVLRSGRLPNKADRYRLMQGMTVGGAACDEDATSWAVPAPDGVEDSPGTHMYMAITTSADAPAVAEVDQFMHDPAWTAPPLWADRQGQHAQQCRARVPEENPA